MITHLDRINQLKTKEQPAVSHVPGEDRLGDEVPDHHQPGEASKMQSSGEIPTKCCRDQVTSNVLSAVS